MKKCTILTLLLAITVLSGCSRFRQLTRRDYALLEDPFTSELTEQPVAAVGGSDNGASGSVMIGDLSGGPAGNAVADYGGIAGETAASPVDSPLTAFEVEQPPLQSASAASGMGDMASMASFMKEQAESSGLTDTADDLTEDFSEYAARRAQQWNDQVAEVEENAADTQSVIQQASRSVSHPAGELPTGSIDVLDHLTDGNTNGRIGEMAQPLITARNETLNNRSSSENAAARQSGTSAGLADRPGAPQAPIGIPSPFAGEDVFKPESSAVTVPEPVFDNAEPGENPFADSERHSAKPTNNPFNEARSGFAPSAQPESPFDAFAQDRQSGQAMSSAPESATLDGNFSFDSGWRPSSAVPANE